MNMRFFVAAMAIGLASTVFAQAPTLPDRPGESSRPLKPEHKCDVLTGAQKEQCLRDERRMPDSAAQGPTVRGSCDALIGPEKEHCLKRGGTIEAGAKAK